MVTNGDLRRSTTMKVFDIPLAMLADNRSNPRDSSPVLLAMGYSIFKESPRARTDKPVLMDMALGNSTADQAAFVDLIEHYESAIASMAVDILDKGLLQPIGVCKSVKVKNAYEVVYGCRRVLAYAYNHCKIHIRNPMIPARIHEFNEHDRCFVSYAENYQRLGLTAIDEAKHFEKMQELEISIPEIAKRCGVQDQHVRRRLKLNELPQAIQDQVAGGVLAITKAEKMAGQEEGEIDEEKLKKKKTRSHVPTLREWKDWYENDKSISEEVRRFIAARVLHIHHVGRKDMAS